MAALVKCKACGTQVSKKAKTCPSCGEPMKRKPIGCLGAIAIIAIAIGVASVYMEDEAKRNPPKPLTAEQKKQKELDSLRYIAQLQLETVVKKSLRDPDSYDLINARSEERNGGLYMVIEYRAKNGFGGFNVNRVAATFDKRGMITAGPTSLDE